MSPVCDALGGGLGAGDVPRLEAWLAAACFAAAMIESEDEVWLEPAGSEVCSVMTLPVWLADESLGPEEFARKA